MGNKQIWNSLFKTDPKFTKPITGKTYSGTSPDPYYVISRLTDTFGPCGFGWGVEVISQQIHEIKEDKAAMHFCLVSLWYVKDDKKSSIQAFGGTQLSYVSSRGKLIFDEDAPKKSMTDAMVKAASMLGLCGDIFTGLYDDSKYVAELRDEFRKQATKDQPELHDQIKTDLANGGAKKAAEYLSGMTPEQLDVIWGKFSPEEQTKLSNAWPK